MENTDNKVAVRGINHEFPDINERCKKQIRSTGNNKNART